MVSENVVLKALQVILDPSAYPLLVCCGLGRHYTGEGKEEEKGVVCGVVLCCGCCVVQECSCGFCVVGVMSEL